MGALSIGRRLLATGLLGLLCTGCTPTPSLRDLSMEEPQHDPSNGPGESGARTPQTARTTGKARIAKAPAPGRLEAMDGRPHDVLTRVRLAYFDLLAARRERDTMEFMVESSEKTLQTAQTLEKRSGAYSHQVLRAKNQLEQNRLKKEAVVERVAAAEKNMLTVLDQPPFAPGRLPRRSKETDQILLDFDWQTLLASLRDSSTELQAARALIAQQEELIAEATNRPVNELETPLPRISSVPESGPAGLFTKQCFPSYQTREPPLLPVSLVLASEPREPRWPAFPWSLGFEPREPPLPALTSWPDFEPKTPTLRPLSSLPGYASPMAVLSDLTRGARPGRPTFGNVIGLEDGK